MVFQLHSYYENRMRLEYLCYIKVKVQTEVSHIQTQNIITNY